MKDFLKWSFNDRKHRNRIIFSTLFLILVCVLMILDPATIFLNIIFLSIIFVFYFANWLMIYKLYKKNK